MSEVPRAEDLAVVQAFIDAFNAGDVDRCIGLTQPDVVLSTAREWPGGGRYDGQDEIGRFLEEFLGDFARIRYEHLDPEDVNGRIVERARWVATGRTSGIESSVDFYSVWSLGDGLISRLDVFALKEEARGFARGR
jgi:ketosteroid isomerase-like protein